MVLWLPVGLVVDVGVLGCCQTGVFGGDQAELDELAVFDDVVEPVAIRNLLAGRAYRW